MMTKEAVYKYTNEIIEDHGDWLLVDISTPKFPDATMAVDTDVFDAHEGGRIRASWSRSHNYIYAMYTHKRCFFSFHRDAIDVPDGMEVDHITHGTMSFIDNRRCNLRSATRSQNSINKPTPITNTSGVKGVSWYRRDKKWYARIKANGKQQHLGSFEDINDAIEARRRAEEKYHGEFAHDGGLK